MAVDPDIELMNLNMRITQWRPLSDDIDRLDAVWGQIRARYFELINAKRARKGLEPLVNDEDEHPELAIGRRERFIGAELASCHQSGLATDRADLEYDYPADGGPPISLDQRAPWELEQPPKSL